MNKHAVAFCMAVLLLGMNFWTSRSSLRNISVVSSSSSAYSDELSAIVHSNEGHDDQAAAADATAFAGNQTKTMTKSPLRPRSQPHTGARDSSGQLGYIADVTRVRRWMLERYRASAAGAATNDIATNNIIANQSPPLQWTPPFYSTNGTNPCGSMRYSEAATRAILKIVPNHPGVPPYADHNTTFMPAFTKRSEEYEQYNVSSASSHRRSSSATNTTRRRLLCAVYTYAGKHEQVTALMETWGWKCDGFFAASTATIDDNTTALGYGAINLTHAGPESYGNMWQKTRSILAYMHDHYRYDYDYFWVGGDDTYMVVENIKQWLKIVEDRYDTNTEPLYLGHHVKAGRCRFAGGGPGYILNRKALEFFFEKLSDCYAQSEVSAEDRYLGLCFCQAGIPVQDTADARGQQRFVGYAPDLMAQTTVHNNFFRALFQMWIDDHPRTTMGPGLFSEQAFGLHWFKTPELIHHLHALLYRTCPAETVVGQFVFANDYNNNTTTTIGAET